MGFILLMKPLHYQVNIIPIYYTDLATYNFLVYFSKQHSSINELANANEGYKNHQMYNQIACLSKQKR
jgi:hypothetical protein